jgi:hypothetical protein
MDSAEEPVAARLLAAPDHSVGSFWSRFMDLISATPEMLPIVCAKLSEEGQRALRAVNRTMRVAVNATVTHIRCRRKALAGHEHLHEVFPNLSSMTVDCHGVDELREVLQHLARGSARMLAKLQHLSLAVPKELTTVDKVGTIWEVVNRCTILHSADACGQHAQHCPSSGLIHQIAEHLLLWQVHKPRQPHNHNVPEHV